MKKMLVTLFTLVALSIGVQASQAACPCSQTIVPSYGYVAPCSSCPVAQPCCPAVSPACPVAKPCCDSGYNNYYDNGGCRKKCSWWKFWENKNCCDKCDNCNKCDKCDDCCH